MKRLIKQLLFASVLTAAALPTLAAPPKTEEQLIADLGSPKEKVVYAAMQDIEKNYPTSQTAITKIKGMLTDPRAMVHEKAARVLGALHTDVSADDLKNIAAMLDSADKKEIMEGLKALRGLKAQSTVPKIVTTLKNPDANVKRDACRTLAVLGDKSNVSDIEPLLQDPNKEVVKDANDAIFALKAK